MVLTVYTLIRSGSVIRSLPGVYRPPIGPLATVAKFPWDGMIFYQFRGLQSCKKRKPRSNPGLLSSPPGLSACRLRRSCWPPRQTYKLLFFFKFPLLLAVTCICFSRSLCPALLGLRSIPCMCTRVFARLAECPEQIFLLC